MEMETFVHGYSLAIITMTSPGEIMSKSFSFYYDE